VHDLLHLGLPWWDKVVRTLVVYVGLVLMLRFFGKRQLAQLSTIDLVVLLLLSNVVQNAIIGNETSLFGGLFGAIVLIAASWVLGRLTFVSSRMRWLFLGTSTRLWHEGQIDASNLKSEQMTEKELVSVIRRQGYELRDTKTVDLEPEGTFDVDPKQKPGIEDVLAALERIERKLG
jgi:uncharacterized membrane protein YcaP (DUF421 family)